MGALLGAGIGILGQFLLASRTLHNQRILARDQAMRQWRIDNVVSPFLEAAYRRRSTFTDLLHAADQYRLESDQVRRAARLQEIQTHYTDLLRDQKVTNIAYRSVEVQPFKSAVDALSTADAECRLVADMLMIPSQIDGDNLNRLADELTDFGDALVAAVRECERYIREADDSKVATAQNKTRPTP